MTNNEQNANEFQHLRILEAIRKNVPMYIGDTRFFGFIQYLVSAFDIMLENGATWIEIEVGENFHLSSDAQISSRITANGFLEHFESFDKFKPRHSPDTAIVTALSAHLTLILTDGHVETKLKYEDGERQSLHQIPIAVSQPPVQMIFSPDYMIFSVTEISPAILHSYFRRNSFLYPGVSFRIKTADDIIEYRSTDGIRELFNAIATPYQILHKPIHIAESEDDLKVEAVFVFHSWSENRIWSFSNKGRVPDGGTHEAGMLDAVARLHNNLSSRACPGILAVLAIEYAQVTYEGCIKARIGNPELREKVAALVARGLEKWAAENEEEIEYLQTIDRFQFADIW